MNNMHIYIYIFIYVYIYIYVYLYTHTQNETHDIDIQRARATATGFSQFGSPEANRETSSGDLFIYRNLYRKHVSNSRLPL